MTSMEVSLKASVKVPQEDRERSPNQCHQKHQVECCTCSSVVEHMLRMCNRAVCSP